MLDLTLRRKHEKNIITFNDRDALSNDGWGAEYGVDLG